VKKYFILLLALIIVLSAVRIYGTQKIENSAADLEFELETLCGDVSAAEGLSIKDFRSFMRDGDGSDASAWTTDATVRNGKIESDSTVAVYDNYEMQYGGQDYLIRNPGNHGYGIRARFDALSRSQMMANPVMSSFFIGFSKRDDAKDHLVEENGSILQGMYYRVNLSEFFDYYPYLLEIDLPDDFNVTEEAFREFLKIPVLKNEEYKLTGGASPYIYDAALTSDPDQPADIVTDFAQIDTFGGLTDDAYYFTFRRTTKNGGRLDTSEIPLGYGIYRLAKDGTFSLFKALPEDVAVRNFGVDNDGKTMYLHLVENNKWTVCVIDIASGNEVNRIQVKDHYANDLTPKIFHGNGSEVIAFLDQDNSSDWGGRWYASEIYVVNRDGARVYADSTLSIDLDTYPYSTLLLRGIGIFSAVTSGDKLAIVKRDQTSPVFEKSNGTDSNEKAKVIGYDALDSSFMIMIIGPDGLEYCGRGRCSLDKASVFSEYGRMTRYRYGDTDSGIRFLWYSAQTSTYEDYYLTW